MEDGIISRFLDWLLHPYSAGAESGTIKEWLAGLILIIIVSFLWSTVVTSMEG